MIDLERLRQKLAATPGLPAWKSLEEAAGSEEFRAIVEREFPEHATEWNDSVSRRDAIKLMGASMALAGLTACGRQPLERIFPYHKSPEELIPGKPLFYASALPMPDGARGVLVKTQMGRPIKLEGNPEHPISRGRTDLHAQAAVLDLYDPDRSQTVKRAGDISTWANFASEARGVMADLAASKGDKLAILSEPIISPSLAAARDALLLKWPGAEWYEYAPCDRANARAGAIQAFGSDVQTLLRLERADVILAIESDFLVEGAAAVYDAADFAARRDPDAGTMNRLYSVESMPTLTGGKADHRHPLAPIQIERFLASLARALGVAAPGLPEPDGAVTAKWIKAVASDLSGAESKSVVVAGESLAPWAHALIHAINERLKAPGHTITYIDPISRPMHDIAQLTSRLENGSVRALFILGGNPAYDAPVDLKFADCIAKAPFTVRLGQYDDETSALCGWQLPEAHWLESWGDARAIDGTVSIVQPAIAPLYAGRSAIEVLDLVFGSARTGHDLVRATWKVVDAASEKTWRKWVHDGVVTDTAFAPREAVMKSAITTSAPVADGLAVNFRPDPAIFDGRFSNNGWLQEVPKPLTKLTWDNAVLMSPAFATTHEIENEELVEIRLGGRSVTGPAWILPGHAQETVTIHLGYGRTKAGRVGNGAGFNAYSIRASSAMSFGGGAEIVKAGGRLDLARTQDHHNMEGRDLIRYVDAAALTTDAHAGTAAVVAAAASSARTESHAATPAATHGVPSHAEEELPSLYPQITYDGYKWGMAFDLDKCTGCNACIVACQAENNIPVVGKVEVGRGREMQWIRLDRYFQGNIDNPEILHQPIACQHCENAPCEPVCPVAATVHDSEGLNVQVYNRCVGTKYCSNNCPYKVRRFNFFKYADDQTESLKLGRNPDVTVRSRGVMEKCSYCVQRINFARIESKKEDRTIREGEVVTACQSACPSNAIVFGDLNNPLSAVVKTKASGRDYGILTELNTRPRTTYLSRVRNSNPELIA